MLLCLTIKHRCDIIANVVQIEVTLVLNLEKELDKQIK